MDDRSSRNAPEPNAQAKRPDRDGIYLFIDEERVTARPSRIGTEMVGDVGLEPTTR